jgi:hypothetical protein
LFFSPFLFLALRILTAWVSCPGPLHYDLPLVFFLFLLLTLNIRFLGLDWAILVVRRRISSLLWI